MSILSSDVGPYAPGHKIVHGGRTYQFRPLSDVFFCEWEREFFRREREKLNATKRELVEDYGEDEWKARRDKVWADYEKHEFSFQNQLPFLKTPEGVVFALALLLQAPESQVFALMRDRGDEVTQLLELVIRESLPTDEKKAS